MGTSDAPHIIFMATSRSGLGHLRRVSSIAAAVKAENPRARIGLFTNAPVAGLTRDDMACFDTALVMDRTDMPRIAMNCGAQIVVADTMLPSGIEMLAARAALILRETPADRLERLRLPGSRPWDLVLIPNPAGHWQPPLGAKFAETVFATGWIYRKPLRGGPPQRTRPALLVATGGGGTAETAAILARQADAVIALARKIAPSGFDVVQALGPRAPEGAAIGTADRIIDPGGDLNEHFADADAVISTAGYNSILELAITTTPALLMAIARSYDDQAERAVTWGPLLGQTYRDDERPAAAAWLVRMLEHRLRRPAVDIGPSGASLAARKILELRR